LCHSKEKDIEFASGVSIKKSHASFEGETTVHATRRR